MSRKLRPFLRRFQHVCTRVSVHDDVLGEFIRTPSKGTRPAGAAQCAIGRATKEMRHSSTVSFASQPEGNVVFYLLSRYDGIETLVAH
jgi:hypothetical protein